MTDLAEPVIAPARDSADGSIHRSRIRLHPPRRDLWWTTPVGCLLVVVPASVALTVAIPDRDYRLFYNTPKVVTDGQALLFLLAAGCLALGSLVPLSLGSRAPSRRWPNLSTRQVDILEQGAGVCFWVTVAGYCAFVAAGFARGVTPSLLVRSLFSQSNFSGTLKTSFGGLPGITSLTQVGIAFVILDSALLSCRFSARARRRLIIIMVLSLLRSFFVQERLALLEVVVPLVVIAATRRHRRRRRSWGLRLAPALALPALLVVFGIFEYSRSWVYYRLHTSSSYPVFVIHRLAGYYVTSYNNGALQLDFGHPRGWLPFNSISAVWTSPGLAQLHLFDRLTGLNGDTVFANILTQHGNIEFNNPGGLAVPLLDFGAFGGLMFFIVVGIVIGAVYRSYRGGSIMGVLLYPMMFTGLLEIPRYLYWTEGRAVPAYLALLIVGGRIHRAGQSPDRRALIMAST